MKNTLLLLFLLPLLACTNSENSNDSDPIPEDLPIPEEATTTDKSVNLANAVGTYTTDRSWKYFFNYWRGRFTYYRGSKVVTNITSIKIFELPQYSFGLALTGSSLDLLDEFEINNDFTWKFSKIEDGKWLTNKNGWYVVIPQEGFSEDLSSIVFAYEDSTGRVQAYPFDKVK